MSNNVTRTYTFANGGVADGGQVDSEIQNLVNTINNADAGTTQWTKVRTAAAVAANDAVILSQLKYFQRVSGQTCTRTSTSSATYVTATNIAITITPTSASNLIKLTFCFLAETGDASGSGFATIFRGSTDVATALNGAATNGLAQIFSAGGDLFQLVTLVVVDSPATTSATTYQLKVKTGNTDFFAVGSTSVLSTMTAEEVA